MRRSLLVLPAALALLVCACASRPPEPTADATPATAPPSSPSSSANSGTAGSNTPSGANTSASAASPRGHEVFFAFDSSALSSDAQGVVRQNATFAQPRRAHVRLEGNADERGSREYNLALGQRRAETVRQAMELSGLRADSLEAISNGEERPRCTDHTEDCYAANRRVDILVAP